MRQAGCTQTNPAHPDLIAALDEGVTPQTLADTVREAVEAGKGNPFTWAIATARGRHAQGAKPIAAGPPHAQGPPQHRLSKTALGIASLQELIDDTRHEMAADRTLEGPAEARHALAGPNSRG